MRMLIAFMKEELGFLVTNKVADMRIRPRGGIRQGDSLSPALFALVTATATSAGWAWPHLIKNRGRPSWDFVRPSP